MTEQDLNPHCDLPFWAQSMAHGVARGTMWPAVYWLALDVSLQLGWWGASR